MRTLPCLVAVVSLLSGCGSDRSPDAVCDHYAEIIQSGREVTCDMLTDPSTGLEEGAYEEYATCVLEADRAVDLMLCDSRALSSM